MTQFPTESHLRERVPATGGGAGETREGVGKSWMNAVVLRVTKRAPVEAKNWFLNFE